jgi:hypothetical protein
MTFSIVDSQRRELVRLAKKIAEPVRIDLHRAALADRDVNHLRSHPNKSRPTSVPTFRWRPLLVKGIPIRRDSRALAAESPIALFHEKPPKPICVSPAAAVVDRMVCQM